MISDPLGIDFLLFIIYLDIIILMLLVKLMHNVTNVYFDTSKMIDETHLSMISNIILKSIPWNLYRKSQHSKTINEIGTT